MERAKLILASVLVVLFLAVLFNSQMANKNPSTLSTADSSSGQQGGDDAGKGKGKGKLTIREELREKHKELSALDARLAEAEETIARLTKETNIEPLQGEQAVAEEKELEKETEEVKRHIEDLKRRIDLLESGQEEPPIEPEDNDSTEAQVIEGGGGGGGGGSGGDGW